MSASRSSKRMMEPKTVEEPPEDFDQSKSDRGAEEETHQAEFAGK